MSKNIMATNNTYTIDTGTASTYDTGTASTYDTICWHRPDFFLRSQPIKLATPINILAKPVITRKGFWDGVKWEEFKAYRPRKSITGKIIIGKMHKRHKKVVIPGSTTRTGNVINTVLGRATFHTQYAKTKELFEEKLKGKA